MRRPLSRQRNKTKTRAANESEKLARRSDLLQCTKKLFEKFDYTRINITDICELAKLAKGSFYLYFKTKEEAFLSLTQELMEEWNQKVVAALDSLPTNSPTTKSVQTYTDVFQSSQQLLRLLSMLHPVLERNVAIDKIVIFKQSLNKVQEAQSQSWARLYPSLTTEDLFLLFGFLSSSILGVWAMTNPPPSAKEALKILGQEKNILPFEVAFQKVMLHFMNGLLQEKLRQR
jgi:TetR/AcrR family transcriptional regulator